MLTLLLGSNFSGRSSWLADRRRATNSWPETAFLGPLADTTSTGLAWTLQEELRIVEMARPMNVNSGERIIPLLGLREILDHELHILSGGEAVRAALASVIVQKINELHIDSALEQLDAYWRPAVMSLLLNQTNLIAESIYLADNHLTLEETSRFTKALQFPLNSQTELEMTPRAAAGYVSSTNPLTIKTEQISFRYPRTTNFVFENVSLTLEPGTLYFLLGRNGSGKTTFVKLLSGTILPQRGHLFFGSERFTPKRNSARHTSLAFQNPDYQWTSQSVQHELSNLRSNKNSARPLDPSALLYFGMSADWVHHNPIELPFVLKKRLSIALATLAGKPWLVLDEPTLGQDLTFRKALAELIHEALTRGRGVLAISHDAYFRSLFPKARNLLFDNRTITLLPAR
jgi:energy-coupling factor transporter ATP-binding protein EcfA2